uniref:Tyrosinase_Cu-bd domain-containing protein n=1 Tax=Globodera pallida TaxID=36090 RepID=A0A183C5V9_GLOPA
MTTTFSPEEGSVRNELVLFRGMFGVSMLALIAMLVLALSLGYNVCTRPLRERCGGGGHTEWEQFGGGGGEGRRLGMEMRRQSIYLGDQQCYYDPNNTASTTTASASIGVRERRQAGTPNATLFKCTRKEYRMLSADERTRYHNALLQLKQGQGSYEYNRIAALHSDPAQMPGGHGGPTFVCWHREYLKRLEIALRSVDPSVCLPFWDSTLDWRLPSPVNFVTYQ